MSDKWRELLLAVGLSALAGLVFFFTTKATMHDFDYTARIASALLHLPLGLDQQPRSLLGEAGALFFTLVRSSPFVAGAFFALAFGNRTELILILPIFLYLWFTIPDGTEPIRLSNIVQRLRKKAPDLISFLVLPVTLGILTAEYNFARFHSIFDFGYARLPLALQEPWYQHGLFSLHAIPGNIYHMLFKGIGDTIPKFPYILPYGFGCSIFIASPFLFLLFREGGKYKA